MTGRRRKPGRMGPFIKGYRAWLAGRGYSPGTIAPDVRTLSQVLAQHRAPRLRRTPASGSTAGLTEAQLIVTMIQPAPPYGQPAQPD